MNLITFGFSDKGTPVFINQEPYTQVGTLYLIKAGENTAVGITLDDNYIKLTKTTRTRKPRKAKAEEATEAPKRRGRKPKDEASVVAPKKRAQKTRKPRAKKEVVKKEKYEKKAPEAAQ